MDSTTTRSLLFSVAHDLRDNWKELVRTDVTCKLLAFVLLTPLVSVLFHVLVSRTGRSVLADEDILQFALEPLGWTCMVLVGTLSIAIIALEQVALMSIICTADHDRHLSVTGALRFAGASAWPVLRVTARIVVLTLLACAPLLAAAGGLYWALLREFDINYYLQARPPAFWIAASCGAVIGLGIAAVLLRLATSWFCALPMVCFEATPPRAALRASRERVTGCRHRVVLWIVVWLVVTLLLSSLATGSVVYVAQRLVPRAMGSLYLLLFAVGTTLIIWGGLHVIINVVTTSSFAAVYYRLYRGLSAQHELDVERIASSVSRPDGPVFLLTRRRLVAAIVGGTVLASAIGIYVIHRVRTTDSCEVIAHRGASGSAPGNTMAAVRQAVQEQTDWVEIDVQESADGAVVVFHDSDFMKLARRNLHIWNATQADLQEIDIGSWFHPDFRAERVPTLADVLRYCQGKVRVVIELKYYGHDQNLEERVAEIVEAHHMQSDIVTMSLQPHGVERMKELRPDWDAGLLAAVAVGGLTRVRADFLAVRATMASRAFIRSAHNRHQKVFVWTVNDPFTMSTMIGRGVDGIITDHPALARQVLVERAELSCVERLLVNLAGLLGATPQTAEQ